jgi:anti-sigma regulatory factor (Ser/Thr protein kinase)
MVWMREVQNLDEVEATATELATLFPDAAMARLGLRELILNAVEHGNLEISYEEKGNLLAQGRWREEVQYRLTQPQYRHKKVRLKLIRDAGKLALYIADEGKGFNAKPYLECSAERLTHSHGRGIALAKQLCFDQLVYSDKGNEVLAMAVL